MSRVLKACLISAGVAIALVALTLLIPVPEPVSHLTHLAALAALFFAVVEVAR